MAWTTSASLRARRMLKELAKVQLRTAATQLALLRQSLPPWHPRFAIALPLSLLGLLAPFLHSSIIAVILLTTGAALAAFNVLTTPSRRTHVHSGAPSPGEAASLAQRPERQWADARSTFQGSEIALDRQSHRLGRVAYGTGRAPIGAAQVGANWPELMARVSHELRTPLNAVIGFSELMALELFGPVGDPRYEDYVHHIRDSATELLKSTEDTLALTALVVEPNPYDVASVSELEIVAAEAWGFISTKAAARGVACELRVPAGLEVLGDSRTLRQILVNMLSEAVARAGHGACVVLVATAEAELVQLDISVSKERSTPAKEGNSLAICLARTLLEIQGTSLLEFNSPIQGWRAVTVLDRAAQPDFFPEQCFQHADNRIPVLAS